MASRVKDTDRGYRAFRAAVKQGVAVVQVGIFAGEQGADSDTVNRAFWNEYGTDHIPARPFIASTIDANRVFLQREVAKVLRLHLSGKAPLLSNLAKVGDTLAQRVRDAGENWTNPPNAPSTIKRKGRNDPLTDTGEMLRAVTFRVNRGRG